MLIWDNRRAGRDSGLLIVLILVLPALLWNDPGPSFQDPIGAAIYAGIIGLFITIGVGTTWLRSRASRHKSEQVLMFVFVAVATPCLIAALAGL